MLSDPQTMATEELAEELRQALLARPNTHRAEGEKKYLKSDLRHIGVPVPDMRRIVAKFSQQYRDLDRGELANIARGLWATPVHEYRVTTALLLDSFVGALTAEEAALVEEFVRQSATWAQVDVLAGVVAKLLLSDPAVEWSLRDWCVDNELWVRRSGILGFRIALHGTHHFERYFPIFCEATDPLLTDKRFFVRKAIGWTLREAGKKHPDEIFRWTERRIDRVSGVTIREIVRHLPPQQSSVLLAKYRSR
ncbi:MAG: DNA alkylation repair protein [Pseudonocardiaceae bacterium]